ncbi:hypothetical protein FPSE_10255 [Fusarium pseudograminearum CS3096]|uniref:Uncharacterized protein n=1 Tax=Fusarium pseudograminearum (strain CS3096) TaxID=1028729 RepID=K3V8C9_FUSPC|nr:hypothetical protein FPSE_10255 [Fusarium pseudograminearum CS3096]EKJ69544.1 hypothetical protein FPSE_10255 [Fusarium pseudograminearum CS3096]
MSQQPAKKGESSGNATGNINASAKPAKGQGKGNKSKGPTSDSKEPEKKEESQKTGPKKSTYIRCALLFGDAGPILASHEKFGVDTSCVNRADLYGVWGNTLLPCFLFGHPCLPPPDMTPKYQGGPTIMTTNEKDGNVNFLNRLAADGGVSPLAFFVATGIPVYRLKTEP